MQRNDDPRNFFYNQRQQFSQETSQTKDKGEQKQGESDKTGKQAQQSDYEQKVEEMKRLAQKYERDGEGQLVKDIVSSVIEQKASGNLSNEQLVAFAKRISPLLNNEQRGRLNSLLEQLLKL